MDGPSLLLIGGVALLLAFNIPSIDSPTWGLIAALGILLSLLSWDTQRRKRRAFQEHFFRGRILKEWEVSEAQWDVLVQAYRNESYRLFKALAPKAVLSTLPIVAMHILEFGFNGFTVGIAAFAISAPLLLGLRRTRQLRRSPRQVKLTDCGVCVGSYFRVFDAKWRMNEIVVENEGAVLRLVYAGSWPGQRHQVLVPAPEGETAEQTKRTLLRLLSISSPVAR